jgi:hypothetical protein
LGLPSAVRLMLVGFLLHFDITAIKNAEYGVMTSDYFHPLLVTDVLLPTGQIL